jgi:hypothetical protein
MVPDRSRQSIHASNVDRNMLSGTSEGIRPTSLTNACSSVNHVLFGGPFMDRNRKNIKKPGPVNIMYDQPAGGYDSRNIHSLFLAC